MTGLNIYGENLTNSMILGTALYPNLDVMRKAIQTSNVDMVTVSLKRELTGGKNNFFWQHIQQTRCKVLPNTAGCRTADEARMIAKAAREIFKTDYIKLEVIGDKHTLQPDVFELLKACEMLIEDGFKVLPYCNDDLIVCQRLVQLGCRVLMPLGSYIGSGQGINNPEAFKLLRQRFPDITLIVDAGIGTPSDATKAMELGFDGVLLNSAIALADDPVTMAKAFDLSIKSGKLAYQAKRMPKRAFAQSSTNLEDTPFWQ
ncbi:thiazole synthase [Facilibium subflavum]|uniref:thiazole synthase n=1 Tax=Facilibium subflavum TaxID=2219058 RepID=UPI000E6557DF|nr:thiazole synthase [Facilibium subflavum]